MRVYVTKYALTQGILEKDGEISESVYSMFVVIRENVVGFPAEYFHGEGVEWHRTLDAAKDRAREMRQNKIISLKKSLKKMENLSF